MYATQNIIVLNIFIFDISDDSLQKIVVWPLIFPMYYSCHLQILLLSSYACIAKCARNDVCKKGNRGK